MLLNYCYNTRTGEYFGYMTDGYFTTFPEHLLIVDADVMITNIPTIEQAKRISSSYGYCPFCKLPKLKGKCSVCKRNVVMHKEPKFLGIYRT